MSVRAILMKYLLILLFFTCASCAVQSQAKTYKVLDESKWPHHISKMAKQLIDERTQKDLFHKKGREKPEALKQYEKDGCWSVIHSYSPYVYEAICNTKQVLLFGKKQQYEVTHQKFKKNVISVSNQYVYLSDFTILDANTGATISKRIKKSKPIFEGNILHLNVPSYDANTQKLLFFQAESNIKSTKGGWFEYDYASDTFTFLKSVEKEWAALLIRSIRDVAGITQFQTDRIVALEYLQTRGSSWQDLSIYKRNSMELLFRTRLTEDGGTSRGTLLWIDDKYLVAQYGYNVVVLKQEHN
jgi:hypothetical protein